MATTDDTMIAALLREREGMVQLGRDDRVALIDEQLALRGHTPENGPKAPAKKAPAKAPAAAAAAPKDRQTPTPETT
jgi:hypothetical protein